MKRFSTQFLYTKYYKYTLDIFWEDRFNNINDNNINDNNINGNNINGNNINGNANRKVTK